MEKAVQIFKYNHQDVRTVLINGEICWVAVDVFRILEHSNSRVALSRLDDDEKGVTNVYTPGGSQEMGYVTESGLYSLIFTSRKPEAKAFKRWVTHEVLPAIRKTGTYSLQQSAPQGPVPTISDVLRQRAFLNEGRVPFDLFSMQGEVTRELHYLEGILNKTLDSGAYIENSVGQCFSPYAREILHIPDTERRKYRHQLPDGRMVTAWAYPIRYLPDFRRWLYEVYFPKKYESYRRYRARRVGATLALQAGISRKRIAQKSVSQLSLF
jgi:prophage antirepressor-like protein